MHGADWKRSAGGFVHGFRYLVRAQARFMLTRDYGVSAWPTHQFADIRAVAEHALSRIQNSSALYQMQSELIDVVVPLWEGEANGGVEATVDGDGMTGGGRRAGGEAGASQLVPPDYLYIEEVPRRWVSVAIELLAPRSLPRGVKPRRTSHWEIALEYGTYNEGGERGEGEDGSHGSDHGATHDWPFNNTLWHLELVTVDPSLFLHPVCSEHDAEGKRTRHEGEQDLDAAWADLALAQGVRYLILDCLSGHKLQRPNATNANRLFDPIHALFDQLVDAEDAVERAVEEEQARQWELRRKRSGGQNEAEAATMASGKEEL